MAFVGTDIQGALGAGWPEQVHQLDGTLDLGDPAVLFGTGAEMNVGSPPVGGAGDYDLLINRRRVRR